MNFLDVEHYFGSFRFDRRRYLELVHRILAIRYNLLESNNVSCKEAVVKTGALAFCEAHAVSYRTTTGDGLNNTKALGFSEQDEQMMMVTVQLALEINL